MTIKVPGLLLPHKVEVSDSIVAKSPKNVSLNCNQYFSWLTSPTEWWQPN